MNQLTQQERKANINEINEWAVMKAGIEWLMNEMN